MDFKLVSDFAPTGDQPQAIEQLVDGVINKEQHQTLLGVTGSGKTFTVANVIKEIKKPTLILSHNKTLAAQLYGEFKNFFPENSVEYFVSYYDYYQPEAYIPTTDTFIEKDMSINEEIEKLRLKTTSALLSGRQDVVVVSSVSCLYGMGNPEAFRNNVITIKKGDLVSRNTILTRLVQSLYSRSEADFLRGNFRVKGDTVDIFLAYADYALRIEFWGDEIETVYTIDPITAERIETFDEYLIYPANIFVTEKETMHDIIFQIGEDMEKRVEYLQDIGQRLEAKRLKERTVYDMEMMRELGYCSGIENYSRYFDGRAPGSRPFCLIDYFPDDFLMVIDESHVTVPQIRAMYGGDRSRKENLVEHGFRLPAALDNRPLKFEEYEQMANQTIYISATPADYEMEKSEGVFVEQIIRPTGLLDPIIEVRPSLNQIDDLMEEIHLRVKDDERVLITTLTKRMAEELNLFLLKAGIRCEYIHSDVETLERVEILDKLREGLIDVLIGVNLLREGIDLPQVSLVAILDADKEGFLRSKRALVQTVGRAARNVKGKAIMYADRITKAMNETIEETERRRIIQMKHNEDNGMVPTAIVSRSGSVLDNFEGKSKYEPTIEAQGFAAENDVVYTSIDELENKVKKTELMMKKAAKDLDFMYAAQLRDCLFELKKQLLNF